MFAKLFDTPHGQLLVTKEFEEDEYQLAFRGVGNHCCSPTVSFTFETKEDRDRAFDATGQEHADRQAAEMAAVVEGLFPKKGDEEEA